MSIFDHLSTQVVGKHRVACPVCDRGTKDTAGSLTVKDDGFQVFHCFRCEITECQIPDQKRYLPVIHPPRPKVATNHKEQRIGLSPEGAKLWDQCLQISGVAREYLEYRHCVIPPLNGHLRWAPELKHFPTGHVGPALVALITDVHTQAPLSLHRTWITATGKADLNGPAKMLWANHSIRNGVIRLWPDDAITNGLAVGEGIETCLSLAHGYRPVWSLIDAGHLADFPVLDGIENLLIARDRDTQGERAARACADRWFKAGKRVLLTQQSENDINDVLTKGGHHE